MFYIESWNFYLSLFIYFIYLFYTLNKGEEGARWAESERNKIYYIAAKLPANVNDLLPARDISGRLARSQNKRNTAE